jgi:hypothetical protein
VIPQENVKCGAMGCWMLLVAALLAWVPAGARACTFFASKDAGGVWAGNNEDYNYPRSRVWFHPAEPGRHGRVVFGFESGDALGGMNDQGLMFDWVGTGPTGWRADPEKPPVLGQLGELALEKASTVEEAIALFRKYNEPQLAFSHPVLADRNGDSAVLGWADGQLTVTRAPGKIQVFGFGERPARPLLERISQPSAADLVPVLRAALQYGEFATKYSNLYDLERRRVYWYDLHRGAGPFVFDLAAELARGPHFYELLELPGQLDHPSRSDQRTLPTIELPERALAELAGQYRLGDTVLDLTLEEGRPLARISEEPYRQFELVPVAADRLVARHVDADLRFERGADGRIAAAVLSHVSIGTAEHPVPNPRSTFRLHRVAAAPTRILPALAERPARLVEAAVHGRGRMRLVEGVRFLTLEGSYEQMGEQYGALMSDRMGVTRSTPLAPEQRERLERSLGPRFGPFLRGVASGLSVAVDDLLRIVFSLPRQGCSSILARVPGAGSRLLHAKNLDLPEATLGGHAVVELRPTGELRFLATTLFGISDGMNERGISISFDAGSGCPASAPAQTANPGAPELLGRTFDLLATAGSLADADRVVSAVPVDAAMILVVGAAAEMGGTAYDLACGMLRRTPMGSADHLFATNTYLHPDLTPPGVLRECPRYRVLDVRLRAAPISGPAALADVLADAGAEHGVNNWDTLQSVIYDGRAGVIRLAVRDGYAAWGPWLEYDWRRDRFTVLASTRP